MSHPSPLSTRHFVLTVAGLFTTALTVLIIISPIDGWWLILFPREAAVYHLQNSRSAMPFRGCWSYPAEDWQTIRAEANAAALFDSVATYATTAPGLVLGLAGLYDMSSPRFVVLRDSLLAHTKDSLRYYRDPAPPLFVKLRDVLGGPVLDSAVADLKRPPSTAEC